MYSNNLHCQNVYIPCIRQVVQVREVRLPDPPNAPATSLVLASPRRTTPRRGSAATPSTPAPSPRSRRRWPPPCRTSRRCRGSARRGTPEAPDDHGVERAVLQREATTTGREPCLECSSSSSASLLYM
jgi:hypothetical protein